MRRSLGSFWWIFIILLDIFQYTNTALLRCYQGSFDRYIDTPIEQPTPLITSCIDPTLTTVIYAFGFTGRADGWATKAITSAYIATKKRNVILLNWEEEAKSGMLGVRMSYILFAVPNALKIGYQMGKALTILSEAGMNMSEVHLLGHSMGAHIMAHAGRFLRANGVPVARITGLDPARYLFEGQFKVQSGLDRTCAKFVDIIHTDPGGYGTSISTGTVDIWPNYSGPGGSQPGCPSGGEALFDTADLCSHNRAWQYFAEAIQKPTSFMATFGQDYESWRARDILTRGTIYVGDLVDRRANGNFYLTTASKSPFGRKKEGLIPAEVSEQKAPHNFTTLLKQFKFMIL